MPTVHRRACNLCEAICGLNIEVEGQRVLSIKGDPEDPLSRGHICPKATALQDLYEDKDRLVRPLRRWGSDFEEISWDTAFDEVASRIRALQKRHGRSALAVYQGNPTVHSVGALTFGQLFTRALHTRSHFSATSADQLPHMLAALTLFGNQFLIPVPDVDNARLIIIVGANPVASNGSMMTAPGIKRRLQAIQERGGRVVVIDPRRTETAAMADQHLFIRPGTDAALLLAMARVLFDDGKVDLGRLAGVIDGVEALRGAAGTVDLAQAASATGVSIGDIRALAHALVEERPAVIYGRFGACTQDFGGLSAWLLVALNALSGNLDRPGGAMFSRPAVNLVGLARKGGMAGHFARRRSRVRGLPEFGGELPVSCLAEEMDTPGDGQLKGLITAAGNPVLSSPDGRRLERALPGLELMVSIDMYVNETTRHAHYILPPTAALEREHYDLIFHALAVRNTARYSEALFEKPADARHDWQIFLELATRLANGRGARLGARAVRAALKNRGPRPIVDLALRTGPYHLSVAQLVRAPHGVDLGALKAQLPAALQTTNARIDLAPRLYLDDVPRLLDSIVAPARQDAGLVLIGRRDLRSNNSWMHNSPRLVKGPDRCTLLMHPDDAEQRGLLHKSRVVVSSRTGEVVVTLEVTDAVMAGVVSMPHGWGHRRADAAGTPAPPGVRLAVATAHAGVSVNDVTDGQRVDALTGNASFTGLPVEVRGAPPD